MDERVEELTKIRNELKRNEAIVTEQTQTIQSILAERDNLYNVIQTLHNEKVEAFFFKSYKKNFFFEFLINNFFSNF